VFRDREELPTSADLGAQIDEALRESQTLVVICSPRAAASRWVNEEILAYKRLGRSSRILCLIIAGEPNASSMPGHEAEECFPPALRFQLGADGNLSSTPAEPIAADMRSGKDGRRDARLKVAAGIAGVGFDELKQRELQRQVRRAVGVSTASLLLLLAMAGLTVAAVLSRREAVQQRAVATAERDRAEQNFRDARDAVDRFYTKVSEEQLLKAEGLQPLRADLLREALDYYQSFLTQRKDAPAFALETAIVQRNVGGILSEVGDPDDALKATRDATISLERLHKNAPGDAQIIARLSECLGDEAVNLHRLNRSEEALAAHDRAISLFETLPDDSPDKTRTELQRLLMTKGAIEAQLGRFDDAAHAYERGIEAAEYEEREVAPLGLALEKNREGLLVSSVQDRSPAAEVGIRVGDTLTRIADIDVRELSDMGEVRTRLKIDSAVPVQMLRGGKVAECAIVPVHLGNFMLASTKYNLGYLYLERLRNAGKAKPWLIAAVDEYRRTLLRPSPATPDIREGMAYAGGALGVCGYRLGDQELQEQGVREGVSASEENARANPAVPRYRSTLAVNLTNLAMLLKARGDLDGAAARCEEAAEHLKTALRLGGNLASDRLQLAQLLNNLGSIICARDGSEASLSIYESALETAAQLDGSDLASRSWSLAIAQLHRNYGTSLADTARTDDAVEAF
jgi:tetratricopeptide (TPR) repeat protein